MATGTATCWNGAACRWLAHGCCRFRHMAPHAVPPPPQAPLREALQPPSLRPRQALAEEAARLRRTVAALRATVARLLAEQAPCPEKVPLPAIAMATAWGRHMWQGDTPVSPMLQAAPAAAPCRPAVSTFNRYEALTADDDAGSEFDMPDIFADSGAEDQTQSEDDSDNASEGTYNREVRYTGYVSPASSRSLSPRTACPPAAGQQHAQRREGPAHPPEAAPLRGRPRRTRTPSSSASSSCGTPSTPTARPPTCSSTMARLSMATACTAPSSGPACTASPTARPSIATGRAESSTMAASGTCGSSSCAAPSSASALQPMTFDDWLSNHVREVREGGPYAPVLYPECLRKATHESYCERFHGTS